MRIDGRLLVPAGAAWATTAIARSSLLSIPSIRERGSVALTVVAIAGVSAVIVAVVLAMAMVVARTTGRVRRASWLRVLAVGASLVAVAGATSAGSVLAAAPAPVAGWADARATATVEGVVTGEAQRFATPRSDRSAARVRLASSTVGARGTVVEVQIPIVMYVEGSVPPPGTRIRAEGRLGPVSFDPEAQVSLAVRHLAVLDEPGPIDAGAQAMRVGLRQALADVPDDPAALVAGLALGDESRQSDDLATAMRGSGLAHLTAVSGGNLAIVLGVVAGLTGIARASLRVRTAVSIVAVAAFTVLVGPQPSVLRAVAMGVIATVGVIVGGRRGGPSVLAAGVLVLVLVAPWLATSWGFALSVVATAGIVLLARRIADAMARARLTARWPDGLRAACGLTLAAQVGTLPVLIAMGGAVGWVSVPANLLAMPLVPLVTVTGLLTAVLSALAPALAVVPARVASLPADGISRIAHIAADAPASGLPWPTEGLGVTLLTVAVVAALVARRVLRRARPERARRIRRSALAFVVTAAVVLAVAPPDRRGWPPPDWLVIACDVGQGDALLINAAPGAAVVVDAGPQPQAVDRCLSDAGVDEVPAIVLTHFHADHVDGLAGVLRDRSVGAVLVSPVRDPVDRADRVDAVLADRGLAPRPVTVGQQQRVGSVAWTVLWPRRMITTGSIPNNASIVLAVSVGGREFLLTGDIEAEAQVGVAPDVRARRFDVVKVPHHGSADMAADLPALVHAPLALVSVGAGNDYGLPAASTTAAWAASGAMVVRTDESGDAAVVPVGSGVGVVTRR